MCGIDEMHHVPEQFNGQAGHYIRNESSEFRVSAGGIRNRFPYTPWLYGDFPVSLPLSILLPCRKQYEVHVICCLPLPHIAITYGRQTGSRGQI